MYACICNAITEQQVRDKAKGCCFTLAHYTKCIPCGKCIPRIKEIIHEENKSKSITEQEAECSKRRLSEVTQGHA